MRDWKHSTTLHKLLLPSLHKQTREFYMFYTSLLFIYSLFLLHVVTDGINGLRSLIGLSKEGWYILKYLSTEMAVLLCGYITFVPAIQV